MLNINLMQKYSENSVIANSSLLSPTEGVKSISPIQENPVQYGYDENDNNMSNETKCETNYSINNKWNNMRNKHLTKHDTNDDVDLDNCVVHHRALSVHVERTLSHLMSSHTSLAQVLSLFTTISIVIHGRTSLTRLSLSTSTCSSLSPFSSTSCTPSCTLSSTTRSSW